MKNEMYYDGEYSDGSFGLILFHSFVDISVCTGKKRHVKTFFHLMLFDSVALSKYVIFNTDISWHFVNEVKKN